MLGSPPGRDVATVAALAAVLAALVVWGAPAAALLLGVPQVVALAGALAAFAALALASGRSTAATVAAIPVLATVNAGVPLVPGPNRTVDLQVVVGDAAVLAGLALLLAGAGRRGGRAAADAGTYDDTDPGRAVAHRLARVARAGGAPGLLLAAFAAWALLTAPLAGHDVRTAAAFGLEQFRFVVYYLVAAGLVAAGVARLRSLAAALAVAVLAHAGFALVQFANGAPLGVSQLGEVVDPTNPTITLLGVERPKGRYLGGLTGNNAALATLAALAVAILAWAAGRRRGAVRVGAVAGIALLGALCVPLSQYDSATVSFATVLVGSLALATVRHWPDALRRPLLASPPRTVLALSGAVLGALVVVLAAGAERVVEALPVVSAKNLDTRLTDYRAAVELALEHPLTGYGGGNVESVAAELGFTGDNAIHSVLFSYLAETGFVGAGLWVAAVALVAGYALALHWSDHPDAELAGYLVVGGAGFLVVAMLDQIWDNHTSMGTLWLFAGALVASARAREVLPEASQEASVWPARADEP